MREQLKAIYTSRFGIGLLGVIVGFILLHFIALTYYLSQSDGYLKSGHVLSRGNHALLKLIIDADSLMSDTQLQEALQQLNKGHLQFNNSQVEISLTPEPAWPLHFNHHTPWSTIVNALEASKERPKQFSFQLNSGQWFNYRITDIIPLYQIVLGFMLAGFLLLGVIIFYGWSILRFTIPLHRFKKSAERLGIDVNAAPIHALGPAIVRETANAMNQMQQRIQDLINNRTKMLAAISHDLRTPITRLKLRAQFIADEVQAEKITKDVDEMEAMISGILTFAQNDVLREAKQKLDLNSLVSSIVHDQADMGHAVEFNSAIDKLPFFGRPLALKRAFNNIINNAIKYAPHVWISIQQLAGKVVIRIEDDGPGIPEAELKKVLEAYYRAEHGKAKSSTGSGLGLTIAREIVHSHDGTIQLQNKLEGGLQVDILLPN